MITVEVTGDTEVAARLTSMPARVRQALVKKLTELSLRLEAKIKGEKLSGQVLNVVTGNLRRSIHQVPLQVTETSITAGVASSGDVKYAAIHEYGGKTSAHEIVATKAQALHFMMGGKDVFFKRVQHPGSVIPERSFMRSSLAEMREEITSGIKQAVREATSSE